MKLSRRVVVTGLGAVSSLGNTVVDAWRLALDGQSGVGLISEFDTELFATKFASVLRGFDASAFVDAKELRRLDPFIHYAIAAASEALTDAGLNQDINDNLASRIGVAVGSGVGGLGLIEDTTRILDSNGPRRVSPFYIPGSIINMPSGLIAQKYNCQGPNVAMVSACASSAHSIGLSARMIAYGDADIMVTGGSEKGSTETSLAGFNSAKALSKRNDAPQKASRPWDRDRDGFVLGDGAGVLILEELEHAKARGAHIYAELIGFGMSGDAYHMTAAEPSGRGMRAAMSNALADASLDVDGIDYVNAHGTSTPLADPIELNSVKAVFSDHAYRLAMSSTKSMTGHLLGAAGAVEAIFSILAIRDNVVPPTINLDNPEEGCDLNLVAHTAQEREVNTVLSNSFGFGGTNVSLIFAGY